MCTRLQKKTAGTCLQGMSGQQQQQQEERGGSKNPGFGPKHEMKSLSCSLLQCMHALSRPGSRPALTFRLSSPSHSLPLVNLLSRPFGGEKRATPPLKKRPAHPLHPESSFWIPGETDTRPAGEAGEEPEIHTQTHDTHMSVTLQSIACSCSLITHTHRGSRY